MLPVSTPGWYYGTKTKGTCTVTDSVYVNYPSTGEITLEAPLNQFSNYCVGQNTKIYAPHHAKNNETFTWQIVNLTYGTDLKKMVATESP
jgi:hypothetical protein